MKKLLKNANVVAFDEDIKIYKNGYVGIQDDRIIYVSERKPAEEYDIEKDMSNKLLVPGFINGHSHSPMTLLRGVGSGLPLDKWLQEMFAIEAGFVREDVSIGTKLALLEMIACGTTSFSEMYYHPEATIEEVVAAKVKANVTSPMICIGGEGGYKDQIRKSVELYEKYNEFDNGRILVDFCIHAEYTSTEKSVREYCEASNNYDGNLHIHLSETMKEHMECIERHGKSPTRYFNDLGAFDSPAQAAHCVMVDEEDLMILKEKGVSVIHNPTSNMKLGSGFAPMEKMLALGLNVTLGTDGAGSNNNLNIMEEMNLASLIHKGRTNDPTLISTEEVFRMATVNGAKMQGRDDIGAIYAGKKADIVAIDLDKPHLMPALDPLTTLMFTAQGSDVCMTMVDGEVIYENGQYYTIDVEKTKFEVKSEIEKLYG